MVCRYAITLWLNQYGIEPSAWRCQMNQSNQYVIKLYVWMWQMNQLHKWHTEWNCYWTWKKASSLSLFFEEGCSMWWHIELFVRIKMEKT